MPRLLLTVFAATLISACADRAALPPMETHADTLAMTAYEGLGGPDAWQRLPYLRFDFGMEQDGQRRVFRHHLWNRQSGDYRVEWTQGDSALVVLFDTDDRTGDVFVNGLPVADTTQERAFLEQAYRSYINDTYWMLAPTKMLDPGVNRTYVADSSRGSTEVVRLTFDDVGLTPGDTYWLHIDTTTGRVERWDFRLQSGNEGHFRWTGYEGFDTEAGSLYVATRKEALDGPTALLTDNVAMPRSVPDSLFTSPHPVLETW